MAILTYNCTNSAWSWESTTNIVYEAVYDQEKNCTIVTFGNCSHAYYGISGYGTVGSTKITVTANDNISSAVTSIFSTAGATNGGVSTWYAESDGSSIPRTIIVQHSSSSGEKSVSISATTDIRVYLGSSDNVSYQSFSSSDSTSIIVGVKSDDIITLNYAFNNRNQSLTYNHMIYTYAWESIVTIGYTTIYDPIANATTITFTDSNIAYSGEQGYNTNSVTTITVTPTDNIDGSSTVTMSCDGVTNGAAINTFVPTFSSNSVTVYHSNEDGEKHITVSGATVLNVYLKDSNNSTYTQSTLNFDGSMMAIVGTNIATGIIYIDNGISFDAYQCYIDNGTGWDLYVPYIDNGTSWDIIS